VHYFRRLGLRLPFATPLAEHSTEESDSNGGLGPDPTKATHCWYVLWDGSAVRVPLVVATTRRTPAG
jgi:hypothetical protein